MKRCGCLARCGWTARIATCPAILAFLLAADPAAAVDRHVPAAFPTIQAALDAAQPGDSVVVASGVYREALRFPRSGSAAAGKITLRAAAGAQPVVDGTGVPTQQLVRIESRSHVAVVGLEIRNLRAAGDGSAIRVEGSGEAIEIRDNHIHHLSGESAMAITVYGTAAAPIEDLLIAGNDVHDCTPAPSEAITVNGNVRRFTIRDNSVRDVDNIAIDAIGGERDIQPDPDLVARDGTIAGNRVERARSSYGGGFAAVIYVDGGRDIVVERNVVTGSDLGIEVGAENAGIVTRGVVVRSNFLYANDKACLVFGGYAPQVGRVRQSSFRHNTCWGNDRARSGFGELWIQEASDNVVEGNLFVAAGQDVLLASEEGNVGNRLDHNLWWTTGNAARAAFRWRGQAYLGFAAYRAASGQDAHSRFVDPQLAAPAAGDFHLRLLSPAIDAGPPELVPTAGESDLDGDPRRAAASSDAGADELAAPTACQAGDQRLCLAGSRFAVTAGWRAGDGTHGSGAGVQLTADTGYFWFFHPANVEVVVKVLDGCGLGGRWWVFAGGLTDVEVDLAVHDTRSGARRLYRRPSGVAFSPLQDTDGFAACP